MQLFNIAGVDLTRHITVPSYQVNEQDVYTKWEDGNHVEHREVSRTRITGKFTMRFMDKDEYYQFLKLIKNNKETGGYIPVSLYVNNINEVKSANVYISFNPANTLPLFKQESYKGFDVTVTER